MSYAARASLRTSPCSSVFTASPVTGITVAPPPDGGHPRPPSPPIAHPPRLLGRSPNFIKGLLLMSIKAVLGLVGSKTPRTWCESELWSVCVGVCVWESDGGRGGLNKSTNTSLCQTPTALNHPPVKANEGSGSAIKRCVARTRRGGKLIRRNPIDARTHAGLKPAHASGTMGDTIPN